MERERVGGKKTFKMEKELNRREGIRERETMLFLPIICEHCPVSWLTHTMEGNQVPQPHVQGDPRCSSAYLASHPSMSTYL